MEEKKFQLGDVVRLKSDGPELTVVGVYGGSGVGDEKVPLYRCMWWAEGKFGEVMIPEPGLELRVRAGAADAEGVVEELPKVWGGLLQPDAAPLTDGEIGILRKRASEVSSFSEDPEYARTMIALLLDELNRTRAKVVALLTKEGATLVMP